MIATNHLNQRMSQRGIKSKMLNLVLEFGKVKADKLILDKKSVNRIIFELNQLKQDLMKINDKGGLVLVVNSEQEMMITTYNKGN